MKHIRKAELIISFILSIIIISLASPLYSNSDMYESIYKSGHSNKVARIDIVNRGNSKANDIKILSDTNHEKPNWCANDKGNCAVVSATIASKWREHNIKFQVVKDGMISINLRGPDKRNDDGIRYPVIVDYRNLKVNGKEFLPKKERIWHDKPFNYTFSAKDGDVIELGVKARKHHFRFSDLKKVYSFNRLMFISVLILSFFFSYKLVQYVAKFKLLEGNSRIDIVFVAVFSILLFIPMSHISVAEKSIQENRMLAKSPSLFEKGQFNQQYSKQFEKWFEDRFLGRNFLIRTLGQLNYNLVNFYKNNKAAYIKTIGWMFNYPFVDDTWSDETEKNIIKNIKNFDTVLSEKGIKLYVLLVPKKESIYNELLNGYGYDAIKDAKFQQSVANIINSFKKGKIIYPYNELKKDKMQDYVFFKEAHHWTDFGAYLGYSKLMEAIKKDFVDIPRVTLDNYNKSKNKKIRDDWRRDFNNGHTTNLLNLNNYADKILKTEYIYYDYKNVENIKCVIEKYTKTFENPKGKYKIFLTGNSQNEDLLGFLSASAKDLKYVRLNMGQLSDNEKFKFMKHYKKNLFDFRPDIVIVTLSVGLSHKFIDFFED